MFSKLQHFVSTSKDYTNKFRLLNSLDLIKLRNISVLQRLLLLLVFLYIEIVVVDRCLLTDDLKVHHVLIMDEVDGMSGNEDRAGVSCLLISYVILTCVQIAELIQMIKDTKIPVICICNDRFSSLF